MNYSTKVESVHVFIELCLILCIILHYVSFPLKFKKVACLIQDHVVVILFFMTSWYWNAGKDIQHKQKDCSMYIPLTDWCTTNSVIFPFPSTWFLYFQQLYGPVHEQFSTFFRKNCSQKLFSDIESNWTVNVTFLRSCTKGSPSLKYLLILISIHVYCLNCGFIEMLDNLITITYTEYWYITYTEYWYITYTEYWYKTLYQVLPVVWNNLIITRHCHDSIVIQAWPDTKSCTYTLCM